MNHYLRHHKENIFYAILFGILFLAPVVSLYVRINDEGNAAFDWQEVFRVWKILGIFLIAFAIHNFLLAPLLIYKRKKAIYALSLTALLSVFILAECATKPVVGPPPHALPPMEQHEHPSPMRHNIEKEQQGDPHQRRADHHMPPPKGGKPDFHPPLLIGEADILGVIFLFLMCAMNLAVKLYFKNEKDRKQMTLMEKENLEHQLEYLKYQINPHFFMNTLNNIHALVDIDPKKAKESIVVLSKMMRYILYEGNNNTIPLKRERDFINNYVELMRLRFTEKVRLTTILPTNEHCEGDIPPLLLITFVENAFKHGISYRKDSFIAIKLSVDGDNISFECSNSKAEKHNEEKGGVGLTNVRQRLDLIYGDRYSYTVSNTADTYTAALQLPIHV